MTLTREEQLILQNLQLRKKLVEMEGEVIRRDEALLSQALRARLELPGDVLLDINPSSGAIRVVQRETDGPQANGQ
jgi:hypothetical protein